MQKSNLNTSQSINTGKVFKILNTQYIYSILSSNLNTCILNTDQRCQLHLASAIVVVVVVDYRTAAAAPPYNVNKISSSQYM